MNAWAYYVIKVAVSAVLIVAISEAAKRSALIGGLIASMPLTSVLAMIWLHLETGSADKIATLSQSVFWLVLPSLVLFVVLPGLLRLGWNFWSSLAAATAATAAAYGGMVWLLERLGIAT